MCVFSLYDGGGGDTLAPLLRLFCYCHFCLAFFRSLLVSTLEPVFSISKLPAVWGRVASDSDQSDCKIIKSRFHYWLDLKENLKTRTPEDRTNSVERAQWANKKSASDLDHGGPHLHPLTEVFPLVFNFWSKIIKIIKRSTIGERRNYFKPNHRLTSQNYNLWDHSGETKKEAKHIDLEKQLKKLNSRRKFTPKLAKLFVQKILNWNNRSEKNYLTFIKEV